MENEFLPYEQALALKELGFDEPCIMCYYGISNADEDKKERLYLSSGMGKVCNSHLIEKKNGITAPLYQQAFRWFREKHEITSNILYDGEYNFSVNFGFGIQVFKKYYSYEEAELECLKKLIEIVKRKNK
jgi:hypothetical protein